MSPVRQGGAADGHRSWFAGPSAVDQVLITTRNVRKGLDTTRGVPRELIEDCATMSSGKGLSSTGVIVTLASAARKIAGEPAATPAALVLVIL
jgi:hypothetical protein